MARSYQVWCAPAAAEQIKRLCQGNDATAQDVAGALTTLAERLRAAPAAFGERLRRLPRPGLTAYVAAQPPLVVHFALNEAEGTVYILSAHLVSEKPS